MPAIAVRPAREADAAAIAGIKVAAWRAAYRGIVPDALLDGLDLGREEAVWRGRLLDQAVARVGVAERMEPPASPRLVGFVTTGPARAEDEAGMAEVWAIYVDPSAQGHGVGRALIEYALRELAARGYRVAVLWVFEANTAARGFYERTGWVLDGAAKPYEIGGAAPLEVRYRRQLG